MAGTKAVVTPQKREDEIDLAQLFRTLWRGKFWIILFTLIGLTIGIYRAYITAVPVYTAKSVVMLESRREQVVDLSSVVTGLSGDFATINTEVQVIRSRGLIEKLVKKLDLTNDPEFNPRLRPPDTSFSLIKTVRGAIRWARGTDTPAKPATAPDPDVQATNLLNNVVDRLIARIRVSNIERTRVFELSVTTRNPRKSALIANTLADLYVLDQIEVKFAATENATQWLSDRVGDLQIELEESVEKVKDFNSGTNLISPEALAALNRQVKETRDRMRETEETREAATATLAKLEAARATDDPQAMTEAANDTTLIRLLRLMTNDDRTAFDTRFQQVVDRAQLEITRAESQLAALQGSITAQTTQIEQQSSDLVTLQQLEREAEASRLLYEYFLNRLKETSIQQGIQQADSRVLSQAVIPRMPSAPRKSLIMGVSVILGLFAGIALVLGRELAQNTFRLAETLENKTGYTVLGQIPAIPARKRKNVLKYLSEKPTSAAAEAIRNLLTSLLLSDLDNPPQIIMSTSSIPGEGKTTQSIALSQNLSGLGKKVLLIEGDMRRRVFAEYFEIENAKGLMSVLSGETKFEDAVIAEPTLRADLLVADKTKTNAADVFSSERFRAFLKELRTRYDYIIIDTPPVLAVPDARVIGQSVDAILYTVKWDSTSQRQVQEGIKSFESVNLQIAGLVLGQINARGMKRYGYGDSYGAYNSYYDN